VGYISSLLTIFSPFSYLFCNLKLLIYAYPVTSVSDPNTLLLGDSIFEGENCFILFLRCSHDSNAVKSAVIDARRIERDEESFIMNAAFIVSLVNVLSKMMIMRMFSQMKFPKS
jgi:hypothetical protein